MKKIILSFIMIIAIFSLFIAFELKTNRNDNISEEQSQEEISQVVSPTTTPEPFESSEESSEESSALIPVENEPEEEKLLNAFDEEYMSLTIDQKIEKMREWFPDGMYWNCCGVDITDMTQDEQAMICTNIPCDHSVYGYCDCHNYIGVTHDFFDFGTNIQCIGFASFASDFLFGKDAPMLEISGFDNIQVGDQIRNVPYDHSFIVISKNEDEITIVEVNENYEDCIIEWDRVITREEFTKYTHRIFTRYVQ